MSKLVDRMRASFDPNTHGTTIPGWLCELAEHIENLENEMWKAKADVEQLKRDNRQLVEWMKSKKRK